MTDLLNSAKMYATLHHVIRKGQLYGNLPYTHHLADVEDTLRSFGETRIELLMAAWLHDIVEDTDVKVRDVEENFGEEVARLVAAVTNESGPNRITRNSLTYPKILAAGPDAVRLKLADRISNVETGGASGRMYSKEHHTFRIGLNADEDQFNEYMWTTLDSLIKRCK